MEDLNTPDEKGFSIQLRNDFANAIHTGDWLKLTVKQLLKDAGMAGLSLKVPIPTDVGLQGVIDALVPFIKDVQSNTAERNNLHYRIDLPKVFDSQALDEGDWARLYLLRSFQKVWLRRHFAEDRSKDAEESAQKHLKH